jgi:hypothetical protein
MRIILVATAVAATMFLSLRASQAYERPWCALTDIGGGVMHENCTIPTFEMCVQEVIAGNRGFCIPNPLRTPRTKGGTQKIAWPLSSLQGLNEAALMKIFPGCP